jgi:hypothetical protein
MRSRRVQVQPFDEVWWCWLVLAVVSLSTSPGIYKLWLVDFEIAYLELSTRCTLIQTQKDEHV